MVNSEWGGSFRKDSVGGYDSKNAETVTLSPDLAQQYLFKSVVAMSCINSVIISPIMLK